MYCKAIRELWKAKLFFYRKIAVCYAQTNVQFGGTFGAGHMLKYTINGINSQ